jgi:hypothetical protein
MHTLDKVLAFTAFLGALWAMFAKRKPTPTPTPRPTPSPPAPPPPEQVAIVINPPFTVRPRTAFQGWEDTLIDLAPQLRGCSAGAGLEAYGISGVPFDRTTWRFGSGVGINVKVYLEVSEKRGAGYDSVFTNVGRSLVGVSFIENGDPYFRWYPTWDRPEPRAPFTPMGCPTPEPTLKWRCLSCKYVWMVSSVPQTCPQCGSRETEMYQEGKATTGSLIVTVRYAGVIQSRELPIKVYAATCG